MTEAPRTIVLLGDVLEGEDFLRLPQRPYDFSKGDRRFRNFTKAANHATAEAERTGIRQFIRVDTDNLGDAVLLVQAVGS